MNKMGSYDYNNYFCVLPFYGYEYKHTSASSGTHCCLLPKDYNIDEIRSDMLNGKRSKWCTACWNIEDKGLKSERLLKNAAMDFYADRDIRFIEQDVREGKYSEKFVQISASNLCNAACVTCDSGGSSKWASLEKSAGISNKKYKKVPDTVVENLDYENLISLNLLAGEPMYEELTFDILEKLIQAKNFNCLVSITTNGSIAPTGKTKEILEKITNLNINLSIDGTYKVFEYMRYPLKWDDIVYNIEQFKNLTDNISVSYTTSNLNVFYHHETIEWFNKNNLDYNYNPVINPLHFRPQALPIDIKEKIFKKYNRTKDLEFFIGNHTPKDDQDFQTMLNVIEFQDHLKGIDIKNYMPEFYNMIEPYYVEM